MFERIDDRAADRDGDRRAAIGLTVDGTPCDARAGDPLALVLLRLYGARARACDADPASTTPLCLMGVCFGCLVQVDGRRNVQACLTPVRAGMAVRTVDARPPGHAGTEGAGR